MTFPTALLLLRALYGCCDLAALFYSHWRGDHSTTETLLETITSKAREQAVIPNLTFHVFAWALFFFQTFTQIEKFSCGQHRHFVPALKPRLLEQYRFHASIMQGWRLPVHSYIHRTWGLLAVLAAFLPREKNSLLNMNPFLFLKKKQVVCNNTAKLCKLPCHTYQTDSSRETGNCQKISSSRQTMPLQYGLEP